MEEGLLENFFTPIQGPVLNGFRDVERLYIG